MKNNKRLTLLILMFISSIALTGCEDDDPDHTPPPGYGAIFIRSNTSRDIIVYINGIPRQEVNDGSDKAYDLLPGVYRVVLDEDGGDRTFRDDVDVLLGKLTVLDVADDFSDDDYDVAVFIRTP